MSGVFLRLPEPTRRALVLLSEREFRDPRDQAALLVTEGLQRAGVLETRHTTRPPELATVSTSAV